MTACKFRAWSWYQFPLSRSLLSYWSCSWSTQGSISWEIPHRVFLSREGAVLIPNVFPMNNSTTSCHCFATRSCHTPHLILSSKPRNWRWKERNMGCHPSGQKYSPRCVGVACSTAGDGNEPGPTGSTTATRGLHLQYIPWKQEGKHGLRRTITLLGLNICILVERFTAKKKNQTCF